MERSNEARKAARKALNESYKQRLKPRMLWHSESRGTYVRKRHGPLPGHK